MRAISLLVTLLLAGCTTTIGGPADPAPDAAVAGGGGGGGPGGSGSGGGGGAATPDAGTACKPVVTANLTSGHHNAGQNCVACHNGASAPLFTLAGTLEQAAGGAMSGGTITIVDANGVSLDVVSQQNGNFYTAQTLAFPVTLTASACPTTTSMVSKASAGGCATSGCHVSGAQGAVHL